MAKNAISVVARTTSAICVRSQSVTPEGQNRPMAMEMESVPIDVRYMRFASVKMTWMT